MCLTQQPLKAKRHEIWAASQAAETVFQRQGRTDGWITLAQAVLREAPGKRLQDHGDILREDDREFMEYHIPSGKHTKKHQKTIENRHVFMGISVYQLFRWAKISIANYWLTREYTPNHQVMDDHGLSVFWNRVGDDWGTPVLRNPNRWKCRPIKKG